MQTCPKCQFVYYPEAVPGGHCPRCLLTGIADDDLMSGTGLGPMTGGDLADEELMAELPDFDIIESLGRGGMGIVWKARERVLDRYVAVKLLLNPDKDRAFVERFTREARIMARLNHPNIVTLYSFGRTRSGHCYLVMELVEGTTLAKVMETSVLSLPMTLQVVTEICAALQHAHEAGYIHRDIKPGNVLLDTQGRVKVADFGLARLSTHLDTTTLQLTKMGFAVGTPHYMAPEQEHGKGEVDHRADIYSLGVVFYQMLTGDLPRGVFGPPSQKMKGDVRLDKLVLRAMNFQPENRYQRVADVMTELQPIREAADPVLRAEKDAQRKARAHRSRLEMTFAGLAALFVGIISAWYVRGWLDVPGGVATDKAGGVRQGVPTSVQIIDGTGLGHMPGMGLRIAHVVRLQPPGLASNADFGRSVSMHGDWLMVGSPRDNAHGTVYGYKRGEKGDWKLVQRIDNPATAVSRAFGYSVALSARGLAVGAPALTKQNAAGNLWLYKLRSNGTPWTTDSGVPPGTGRSGTFGYHVVMDGTTIATTDVHSLPHGALSLFTQAGSDEVTWQSTVISSPVADMMPRLCLLNSAEAFVGLAPDPATSSGSRLLHCLRDGDSGWSQQVIDQPQQETSISKGLTCVAAEGDLLVAGSPKTDGDKGRVWVLRRDVQGHYQHETYLTPPEDFGAGELGKSIAVHGDWIAAGADHAEVDANHRGGVILYHRSPADGPANWRLVVKLKADPTMSASDYGQSVIMDDKSLVIGAPQTLDANGQMVGAVFIYEWVLPLQ